MNINVGSDGCSVGQLEGIAFAVFGGNNSLSVSADTSNKHIDIEVLIRREGAKESVTFWGADGSEKGEANTERCDWRFCQRFFRYNYSISGDTITLKPDTDWGAFAGNPDTLKFSNGVVALGNDGARLPSGFENINWSGDDFTVEVTEDLNDSYCPGGSGSLRYEIHSNEVCGGSTVKVSTKNHLSGETSEETKEIGLRRGERVRESIRVPRDVEGDDVNLITVTVEGTNNTSGSYAIERSANVGVSSEDITVSQVDTPSSGCGGEEVSVSVTARNSGNCDAEADVVVRSDEYDVEQTIDSGTVREGTNSTFSGNINLPSVGEEVSDVELDVVLVSGKNELASGSSTIEVTPIQLDIDSIEVPDSKCVETEFSISASATNNSGCDVDARAYVDSAAFDRVESEVVNVGSERSVTFNIPATLPVEIADQDSINVEVGVEKDEGTWENVGSETHNVGVLKPNLSVEQFDAPAFTRPGSVTVTVKVANSGQCGTNVGINLNDSEEETFIDSEHAVKTEFDVKVLTEPKTFELEIVDKVAGTTVVTDSVTISPHKFVDIDTSQGEITILGGFQDGVEFSGQVVGSGIESDAELNEKFTYLATSKGATFTGLFSGGTNEVGITFDTLQLFNMGATKEFTWVVDGSIKEQSKSFRYTTTAAQKLVPNDILEPNRASTTVTVGPAANIGMFRSKLGLSTKLINKPLIQR